MISEQQAGIYLIIEFDWPKIFNPETGQKARQLHEVTQNKRWIRPVIAGNGGIGLGSSSIWIFWLENYGSLDILLHDLENEISKTFLSFFSSVENVSEKIREEVIFLQ
jgi:hypothetical protein